MSAKLKLVEPESFNARAYAADYLNAKRLKAEQTIIYTGLYSVYPRPHRVIEQRQRGATTEQPQATTARLAWRSSRRRDEVEQLTDGWLRRLWRRITQ